MRLIDADSLMTKLRRQPMFEKTDFDKKMLYVEKSIIDDMPTIEAEPVKHGRCPICNGEKSMLQDCCNGVSVEVDAYQMEMTVWLGDECLAVFSIDYCPNCGAYMRGKE